MTSYEKIYKRFLAKVQDFNLAEVDDYSFEEMLLGWLNSAIVRVRKCQSDLSLRDDETQTFQDNLSDLEIELLAMGMVDAWVTQYLQSTELMLMMIGGKEEKYYSQASHIAELRAIKESNMLEMNRLHNYNTYINHSYFDK